jgi:signal transduction histidine kinase
MRVRLLALAAATTSLVVVAFIVPLFFLIRSLARENALNRGLLDSQQVVAAIQGTTTLDGLRHLVSADQSANAISSSIWLDDGTWVGPVPPDAGSPSLVLAHGTPVGTNARQVNVAYRGGLEIWNPVAWGSRTLVVRTFVPPSIVQRGVLPATLVLVGTGAVLLIVAMLVADRLARRTAAPVIALAETAHRLSDGELHARAPVTGFREVAAVGSALNRLAQRITELLDAEREQVADLSHRLRTPLAALRLAAEGLPASPEATRVLEQVDALERAVGDVIREARRGVRAVPAAGCDAAEVVRQRAAFWSVLAEDQKRRMDVYVPDGPCPVAVGPEDLAAAVDALLENVFAHTPEGVGMCVTVERLDGQVCVEVADDGPGIPDGVVHRGRSGAGSTGLGLDIARRTAESGGGELRIGRSPSGGAAVRLSFRAVG